ncbi:MAG: hypothetical protein ACQETB_11180 [Halobacteriota archaeon]
MTECETGPARVLQCQRCGPTLHTRQWSEAFDACVWRCEGRLLLAPARQTTLFGSLEIDRLGEGVYVVRVVDGDVPDLRKSEEIPR